MPEAYNPGEDNPNGGPPTWADHEATKTLHALLPRGEGPHVEFKVQFPKQARALGQEIAALASSGGGHIFLGVGNNGIATGLGDCGTTEERDRLLRRVEGVYRDMVRPPVRPKVAFAASGDLPVLVLEVPAGSRPVYYCDNVPYVRNVTESRPATPEEVEEACRHHFRDQRKDEPTNDISEILTNLVRLLVSMSVRSGMMLLESRQMQPWLDEFRYDCEGWDTSLTDFCAEDPSDEEKLRDRLEELAKRCRRIASMIRDLGATDRRELQAEFHEFHEAVSDTKKRILDEVSIGDDFGKEGTRLLASEAYKTRVLAEQTENDDYLYRNTEDVQTQAAAIGSRLLALLEYQPPLPETEKLKVSAHALAAIETIQLVADGGRTIKGIRDKVQAASRAIGEVLSVWQVNSGQ